MELRRGKPKPRNTMADAVDLTKEEIRILGLVKADLEAAAVKILCLPQFREVLDILAKAKTKGTGPPPGYEEKIGCLIKGALCTLSIGSSAVLRNILNKELSQYGAHVAKLPTVEPESICINCYSMEGSLPSEN